MFRPIPVLFKCLSNNQSRISHFSQGKENLLLSCLAFIKSISFPKTKWAPFACPLLTEKQMYSPFPSSDIIYLCFPQCCWNSDSFLMKTFKLGLQPILLTEFVFRYSYLNPNWNTVYQWEKHLSKRAVEDMTIAQFLLIQRSIFMLKAYPWDIECHYNCAKWERFRTYLEDPKLNIINSGNVHDYNLTSWPWNELGSDAECKRTCW